MEVAGELAAEEIGYALSLDIPIDRLVGMDEFLGGMLIRHPDFAYVTMVDADGETLYMQGLLADEIDLGDDRMLDLGTPIEVDGRRSLRSISVFARVPFAPNLQNFGTIS